MKKLLKVALYHLPALVQYFPGRKAEGVPQPADDLQVPHQAEIGGEGLQQVVIQQQHLQFSLVRLSPSLSQFQKEWESGYRVEWRAFVGLLLYA